jgi:hypothetical protein
MDKDVFLFDVDGRKALGFDTGLDSRAFARAKFAQFITEPGLIVNLDGEIPSVASWKADGVVEYSGVDGQPAAEGAAVENQPAAAMVVWGTPFKGERFDLLLHDNDRRGEALAAIRRWIQAVLGLGENRQIPLWPCAVLIGENPDEVFFAPAALARHCLMSKESNQINRRYVHPALKGLNAAAFTAAAMLYNVFAGSPAFSAADEIVLHEDMSEGNFLPVRLAAPGLDEQLTTLIQIALSQGVKKDINLPSGKRLLERFLESLLPQAAEQTETQAAPQAAAQPAAIPLASFFGSLSEAHRLSVEKEKTQYLKTKTVSVKTRRFVKRNAVALTICFAAVLVVILIANSIIKSRSALSTAGMEPVQVIESYYNAFGKLDHLWMEACVIKGAGKEDINMVMNFFVFDKIRQAYEMNVRSSFIPASDWLEMGGGQVNFQVFGVADMQAPTELAITASSELAMSNEVRYRVDYTLWIPGEAGDDSEPELNANRKAAEYLPPKSFRRTDIVTLVQRKGNWRISEINRESAD